MDDTKKELKQAATDFLQLASSGKARKVFDLYVADDFRHHNAYFKGDRQSLLTAMEENAAENPNKIFTIHRALQDGDLVAVHSHVKQNAEDTGAAVVHIFRFKGNRVVELWDLGQAVEKNSVNENGMF